MDLTVKKLLRASMHRHKDTTSTISNTELWKIKYEKNVHAAYYSL